MLKERKYVLLVFCICIIASIIGCGCSKFGENEVVVTEPYSIRLYFEKKHSGELLEKRVFEAETKRQFDRLVNKYIIFYNQNDCIYKFDKEFFKNNKVYIIHKNFLDNVADRKYRIVGNNDIIDIQIYETCYLIAPFESNIKSHGDLVAVSKEFAKDVKGVTIKAIMNTNTRLSLHRKVSEKITNKKSP